MFTGVKNWLHVEDASSGRSVCQVCSELIPHSEPRVKFQYDMVYNVMHLKCHKPRYTAPFVVERDVTFGVISETNRLKTLQWVDDWNVQFTASTEVMPVPVPSLPNAAKNSLHIRALALVFEYLQPPEVVALGSVCSDWYAASWKDSVWIHFSTLEGFTITVRPTLPTSRSCYFYSKANLCSHCLSVPQDFSNSYRSPLKPVFLCEVCIESEHFISLTQVRLSRSVLEFLQVPTVKLDGRRIYTYNFIIERCIRSHLEKRRQAILLILQEAYNSEATVAAINSLDLVEVANEHTFKSIMGRYRILPYFGAAMDQLRKFTNKEVRLRLDKSHQ
jgi:hypothetical protein